MNNKIIMCIVFLVGVVVGFLVTAYFAGEEISRELKTTENLLLRYQFSQGMADRCAVEVGIINVSSDIEDNFNYTAYRIGYDYMDKQIIKKQ